MNEEPKTTEQLEEEMIDQAFQQLLDAYLASKHRKKVEIITKAFNFAKQAHKGVRRRSGEPYIMHPIAVAMIVCSEIGLGSTSICSDSGYSPGYNSVRSSVRNPGSAHSPD